MKSSVRVTVCKRLKWAINPSSIRLQSVGSWLLCLLLLKLPISEHFCVDTGSLPLGTGRRISDSNDHLLITSS